MPSYTPIRYGNGRNTNPSLGIVESPVETADLPDYNHKSYALGKTGADVRVTIGGKPFLNFKQFRISRNMKSESDTFSFTGVEFPQQSSVTCGQRCRIWIGGEQVFTGFVTSLSRAFSRDGGSSFSFAGVDTLGYLRKFTACEVWQEDATPAEVLKELARQVPAFASFTYTGLTEALLAGPEGAQVIEDFKIDVGEEFTVVLDKIATVLDCFVCSDAAGNISFGTSCKGGNYHRLSLGATGKNSNTVTYSVSADITDTVNELVIVGGDLNEITSDDDNDYQKMLARAGVGETESIPVTNVPDLGITRYMRSPEQNGGCSDNYSGYLRRASHSITTGYFKMDVFLAGFSDENGLVWKMNKPVFVRNFNPRQYWLQHYQGEFITQSVTFEYNMSSGSTTNLTLVLPESF